MRIDVVTLFPELFEAPLATSLLGKAVAGGVLDVRTHDLRAHGIGKHRSVDDEPYGGGAGMILRPEPVFDAVEAIGREGAHVILLSPRGARFDQKRAVELAALPHLIMICGRYEGVDERVATGLADEELSIGDFVLAGGEVAALVVIEAVTRLVPGVVGNEQSLATESHGAGMLEHPQYTRPPEFRGMAVPEILLSGDHGAIAKWRDAESHRLTQERRPDLLDG
jgi:tRNA (guanine37-N1)-methyltransferase